MNCARGGCRSGSEGLGWTVLSRRGVVAARSAVRILRRSVGEVR